MKAYLWVLFLLPFTLNGCAQKQAANSIKIPDQDSTERFIIDDDQTTLVANENINDTNYLRILNGVIINNNDFVIEKSSSKIQYISNKSQIAKLGISTQKPLMLINTKNKLPIELSIDSILKSNSGFQLFLKNHYPVNLPIIINGKLLSELERKTVLVKTKTSNLKSVDYLDSKSALAKYHIMPFGAIEVETQ